MQTQVTYEWTAEEIDEFGDANNVQFTDTLVDARSLAAAPVTECVKVAIGLVRYEGNDLDGETARYYAYLRDDGTLPPVFSSCSDEMDGPPIPQRFLKEAARPFAEAA